MAQKAQKVEKIQNEYYTWDSTKFTYKIPVYNLNSLLNNVLSLFQTNN